MLQEKQLQEIKHLQQLCETEENIQLKLNWDMLKARTETDKTDFFHYINEQLVGFLAFYGFGNKFEICGMVHPNFRRQGIFSKLFTEAMETLSKTENKKEVLLNAPANSESAKGWLQKAPCQYSFSEHQMKWNSSFQLEASSDVILRKAEDDDFDVLVQLDVQCFDFEEQGAIEFNKTIANNGISYVMEHEGKRAGKIRVDREKNESWIYGFAVFPSEQGKGIGRKTLSQIVMREAELGQNIFLEVVLTNDHAKRLYESCGFEQFYTQDYYQVNLQ